MQNNLHQHFAPCFLSHDFVKNRGPLFRIMLQVRSHRALMHFGEVLSALRGLAAGHDHGVDHVDNTV